MSQYGWESVIMKMPKGKHFRLEQVAYADVLFDDDS